MRRAVRAAWPQVRQFCTKMAPGMLHVHVTSSSSLKSIVSSTLGVSSADADTLIRFGGVYCKAPGPQMCERKAKRELRQDFVVQEGSYCRIHPQPRTYTHILRNVDWGALIVKETPSFLIVNKPAGVPSSPPVDNLYECVPECLKTHFLQVQGKDQQQQQQLSARQQMYLQVLHRLDCDTCGLMVLSKNPAFTRAYNMQLAAQVPRRRYRALISCWMDETSSAHAARQPCTFAPVHPGQRLRHSMVVSSRSPKVFTLAGPPPDGRFHSTQDKKEAEVEVGGEGEGEGRDEGEVEGSGKDISEGKPALLKHCESEVVSASPYVQHSLADWEAIMNGIGPGPWHQWLRSAKESAKERAAKGEARGGFLGFQQVEVMLITGRTHQLRGQLSNLGHADCSTHIAGDANYSGPTMVEALDAQGKAAGYRSSEVLALQSVEQGFCVDGELHEFRLADEKCPWWPLAKFLLDRGTRI